MVEILLRAQLKNNKNGKVAQHVQQAVDCKGEGESQQFGNEVNIFKNVGNYST